MKKKSCGDDIHGINYIFIFDTLCFRKIIPLPTFKASLETSSEALYDKGATVMAIYPQVRGNVFISFRLANNAVKGLKIVL